MKRLTVFCGSSSGKEAIYAKGAAQLGQLLAQRNIELVYGGANVGLMGVLANAVLQHGGIATGVLPEFLKSKEIAHNHLTRLILVDSMHERKAKMNELSDGVIALPGGYGTMEEFFEMLTWAQLGLHKKPIALMNIAGFYDPLISLLQTMLQAGFLNKINREMILISDNPDELLDKMEHYTAPNVSKWITKDTV